MSAEASEVNNEDQEWSVVPSRSSRSLTHVGSSIADSKRSNGELKKSQQQDHNQRGRLAPQGKGEGNKTSDSPPLTVRLLRRPVSDTEHQSNNTLATVSSTVRTSKPSVQRNLHDDELREKIGAPIIQRSSTQHKKENLQSDIATASNRDLHAENEHCLSASDRNTKDVKTCSGGDGNEFASSQMESGPSSCNTGQSGLERDREREPRKGGLLVLPKKEPVTDGLSPPPSMTFDLASDDQWPSISGTPTGSSGSGQGVCLHNKKGWNSIVKSTVHVPVIKREDVTPSYSDGDEEEDDPVISGETKRKRKKRKKRKSGESVSHQPQQEKKLDTPYQLDLFQYMMQSPTRPVLNRKEVKTTTKQEVSGASGNVLDSTAPAMRRGKEREEPKAKKPTPLRKIIDKEKAVKRELREKGQNIPPHLDVTKDENDPSEHSSYTDKASPATPTFQPAKGIHSKKFREYCFHMVSMEINSVVERLLQDLVRFQDRQHQRDPIRAKSKRRYVCGLREVYKHLGLGKLKCVIIPPNLDHIQSTGGIDERVYTILALCHEKTVPVVFAMSRRRLAAVLKKKFKMGCVGIFSYDGAEGHYRHLMKLVEAATERYKQVALLMNGGGSKEEEISTAQEPQPPDSTDGDDDSLEEDESLIPVLGNENVESSTDTQVMNTPWKIFFPQNVDDSKELTDQSSGTRTGVESPTSVDSGNSTSHSTNQNAEKEGDVTVNNPTNENTENGDVIDQTNLKAQNSSDVIVDKIKQFRWNVYATEFKPSFV